MKYNPTSISQVLLYHDQAAKLSFAHRHQQTAQPSASTQSSQIVGGKDYMWWEIIPPSVRSLVFTCICSRLALFRSVCSSEAGSASSSLESNALALLRTASPSLLFTSLSCEPNTSQLVHIHQLNTIKLHFYISLSMPSIYP